MKILALDLGAKTGWCIIDTDDLELARRHAIARVRLSEVYGKSPCPPSEPTDGVQEFFGSRHERLHGLFMWLLGMLEKYQPDVVVYERPFCRGLHATRSLWGMAGVVEAVSKPCATVFDVNPQQLKKWAGRGANQKAGTTLRCHELGVVPVDDNHADAVCLAYYALEAMEKERRKRCQ